MADFDVFDRFAEKGWAGCSRRLLGTVPDPDLLRFILNGVGRDLKTRDFSAFPKLVEVLQNSSKSDQHDLFTHIEAIRQEASSRVTLELCRAARSLAKKKPKQGDVGARLLAEYVPFRVASSVLLDRVCRETGLGVSEAVLRVASLKRDLCAMPELAELAKRIVAASDVQQVAIPRVRRRTVNQEDILRSPVSL